MAANLDLFSRSVEIAVASQAGEEEEPTRPRSCADGREKGTSSRKRKRRRDVDREQRGPASASQRKAPMQTSIRSFFHHRDKKTGQLKHNSTRPPSQLDWEAHQNFMLFSICELKPP